ncbi:MAG: hypothetical protein M1824_000956 [Vezdaea acicularis]|nr:MAG: hypothetical protein M1824_000956 [Vezdaea acicularis]
MAIVGKPLLDIDIQSEISAEDEALTIDPEKQEAEQTEEQEDKEATAKREPPPPTTLSAIRHEPRVSETPSPPPPPPPTPPSSSHPPQASSPHPPTDRHQTLATPAVRHLASTLNIPLSSIRGTGKDGRILKEDVHTHSQRSRSPPSSTNPEPHTTLPLTPIQLSMYRSMTASLSIPSFLYTSTYDYTHLSTLRSRLNTHLSHLSPPGPKLTHLPFLIKAVSHALHQYPLLNARLEVPSEGSEGEKPSLTYRPQHNIGIATTTPAGLVVPVIPNVQSLSILEIHTQLLRLSSLAAAGQLSPPDLAGGTFTISNIGSIAGDVVAPVIVPGQLVILGVGRRKRVPVFAEGGEVVGRELGTVSWAADHRVVDGATLARFSEVVRGMVEGEGVLLSGLR